LTNTYVIKRLKGWRYMGKASGFIQKDAAAAIENEETQDSEPSKIED